MNGVAGICQYPGGSISDVVVFCACKMLKFSQDCRLPEGVLDCFGLGLAWSRRICWSIIVWGQQTMYEDCLSILKMFQHEYCIM